MKLKPSRYSTTLNCHLARLTAGLLVFCLANDFAVCQQKSVSTIWSGESSLGKSTTKLKIQIDTNNGLVSGEIWDAKVPEKKYKLTEIKQSNKKMSFSVPKLGARFFGTFEEKKSFLSGKIFRKGKKSFVRLKKIKEWTQSGESSDANITESWVGKVDMGIAEPVMQFRIIRKPSGETESYFDSITEGANNFKAEWSIAGETLKFDVPRIKLTYRGKLNKDKSVAVGIWSQGGRKFNLTLKKKSSAAKRYVWSNRPQRPKGPFPYLSKDVTFSNKNDGITLAGTLTIPKQRKKFPVVILVSGSGPQDRDETVMEHKPFLVLADYLSRRGIAVLRYDDRGTAESTGVFEGATTEAFSRDTSAAVDFLKKHPRIDSKKIGIVGHSEGGLVAPMVASMRNDVAFLVLLGATGVNGKEIVASQNQAMMQASGKSESEIDQSIFVTQTVISEILKNDPGLDPNTIIQPILKKVSKRYPDMDSQLVADTIRNDIKGLEGSWNRFFLEYDPKVALRKVSCPVLAIWGDKDLQVVPSINEPMVRKALREGKNRFHELVIYKDINHMLQKCKTGSPTEYISIQETVNSEIMKKIADWIRKL